MPFNPDILETVRQMPLLKIRGEFKQGLIVCVQAEHRCSLCFVGIHGYFSLAQSHISMQTEGREAEERPGVWHAAAPRKIWRQTEELAVNKRKYYQCGQFRAAVDTSLQQRKLLKPQQSRLRKQSGRSLSELIQPPDCVQRSRLAGQTFVPRRTSLHKNAFSFSFFTYLTWFMIY